MLLENSEGYCTQWKTSNSIRNVHRTKRHKKKEKDNIFNETQLAL